MLRHNFQMLTRAWRLIIVSALAAWTIALGYAYIAPPQYRATATFLVFPNPNLPSSRDIVTSMDTLDKQSVTATYADILSSERVVREAFRQLGLEAEANRYQLEATLLRSSSVLDLHVIGPDPATAARLANTIGTSGIAYIKSLYSVFDIALLDQATPPREPYSPQPLRDGAIAAGVGLLAGMVVVILKEQLRVPLETLRERSITDRASGAYNQRYFRRKLSEALARSPADPVALGLIRLDGLEDLVDLLPAPVLAELLQSTTTALRHHLRGNDLVGRWERNIFAVLMPLTPEAPAVRTMERLQQALTEPVAIESSGEQVELLPVAGVTVRRTAESADVLLQQAKTALEQALVIEKKLAMYSNKS